MSAISPWPREGRNSLSDNLLRLAACLLWMAGVAWFSLIPEVRPPAGLPTWDKFSHFSAYAVTALVLVRALAGRYRPSFHLLGAAWLISVAYGLLLEVLQNAMGLGRQWEIADLFANALGALSVCVIFRLFLPRS